MSGSSSFLQFKDAFPIIPGFGSGPKTYEKSTESLVIRSFIDDLLKPLSTPKKETWSTTRRFEGPTNKYEQGKIEKRRSRKGEELSSLIAHDITQVCPCTLHKHIENDHHKNIFKYLNRKSTS